MTFEEALDRLGIEVTATRKEARRAYLKLVKVHKPDRDPEGFQRVREAFELVDEQIEWRRAMAVSAEPDAIESKLDSHDRADGANSHASDGDPFDPLSSDDWAVDLLGVPRTSAATADETVDDSESTSTDDVVFWSSSAPAGLLHAALEAIETDEPDRAEQQALRAFEVARGSLNAHPPSAYDAIHVCLLLYANRHPRHGRAVTEAFLQWTQDAGVARELMGGWAGSRLAILHAFLALPRGLHSTPLSIISRGLLDGGVDIPVALQAFAKDKPFAAHETAEAFERYSPMLAEAWAAALKWDDFKPPEDTRPWQSRARTAPPAGSTFDDSEQLMAKVKLVGFLILMALWSTTRCDADRPRMSAADRANLARDIARAQDRPWLVDRPKPNSSPRSTASTAPLWQRIYPSTIPSAPAAPPVDLSKAPAWLSTFCKTARTAKCKQANSIWTAFKAGKCTLAKKRYAWLSTDMMLPPELRGALKRGGKIIRARCGRSP